MRLVIKVGTSTIAHSTGMMNLRHIQDLCRVISDLVNAGHEVILVSSGAIGMGAGKLSLRERPRDMPTKQAAAAVGQVELMFAYDKLFGEYSHTVAQILLTEPDMDDKNRFSNFLNTIGRLLEMGVLPIINENDTVATQEISIGDNDTLGARVAAGVRADLYVILSDINGLYTADPHQFPQAELIPVVDEITPEILALAGGAGSNLGTGGMATKLNAARITTQSGCDMLIVNGARADILYDAVSGARVGTRFLASKCERGAGV